MSPNKHCDVNQIWIRNLTLAQSIFWQPFGSKPCVFKCNSLKLLVIITLNKGPKITLRTEDLCMAQNMNVSFTNETAGDSAIS